MSDDDEEYAGENLSEILEAYNEYVSSEYGSRDITHVSETQVSPSDITDVSETQVSSSEIFPEDSDDLSCSPVFRCENPQGISSSSGETFPEDSDELSPSDISSSSDEKFPEDYDMTSSSSNYDMTSSSSNYIEWSDSSDDFIQFKQEKITTSRPNFALTQLQFEQLCYFVKRYLKSIENNPMKPEWPVHGMDKNQKRHFRRKVEHYKVQNDVLYHCHTYTECVKGETIKRGN